MRDRTEKISPSITFLVQQTPESIAKTLPNITEHFSESDTVRDIKETITLMQNLLKEKAEILDNVQFFDYCIWENLIFLN